eukprot:NODE_4764_length_764_cov_122.383217_g4416_i0.p1 GENE.NODE_4764_length_764_cov_122.383217_g4416_i0~~NODE_4764_length_764_cov_122.383217_g4416_i0.p1  ORF type:complete len:199 (+),score=35.97 NODE_4764_length_764_cov_122.383217_g4416_i0:68-664(+)
MEETNVLAVLKSIQLQNRRIADFQQNSYNWHLQHHANIKKLMQAVDEISSHLEASPRMEAQEDPALYMGPGIDLGRSQNLHEAVMCLSQSSSLTDPQLVALVHVAVNQNRFDELRDSSFRKILPLLCIMLQDKPSIRAAFLVLYKGAFQFPHVFSDESIRPCKLDILFVMGRLHEEGLLSELALDPSVFEDLFQFLQQ